MAQKEKKVRSAWWVGSTHTLSAYFIVALGYIVLAFAGIFLNGNASAFLGFSAYGVLGYAFSCVLTLVLMWLGVMYGAQFVLKKYVIADPKEILKWAMITLVAWDVLGLVLTYGVFHIPLNLDALTGLAFSISQLAVFYIASKKYLHA